MGRWGFEQLTPTTVEYVDVAQQRFIFRHTSGHFFHGTRDQLHLVKPFPRPTPTNLQPFDYDSSTHPIPIPSQSCIDPHEAHADGYFDLYRDYQRGTPESAVSSPMIRSPALSSSTLSNSTRSFSPRSPPTQYPSPPLALGEHPWWSPLNVKERGVVLEEEQGLEDLVGLDGFRYKPDDSYSPASYQTPTAERTSSLSYRLPLYVHPDHQLSPLDSVRPKSFRTPTQSRRTSSSPTIELSRNSDGTPTARLKMKKSKRSLTRPTLSFLSQQPPYSRHSSQHDYVTSSMDQVEGLLANQGRSSHLSRSVSSSQPYPPHGPPVFVASPTSSRRISSQIPPTGGGLLGIRSQISVYTLDISAHDSLYPTAFFPPTPFYPTPYYSPIPNSPPAFLRKLRDLRALSAIHRFFLNFSSVQSSSSIFALSCIFGGFVECCRALSTVSHHPRLRRL
ncbi:uncharacterized protein JCM6883_000062 [Sporobolomyces salmoneus]|uniref:uncharacterized protein n=1 Tax=Sporobolomyces salmoneus TaxID=183962 RepID=UPI00316FD519